MTAPPPEITAGTARAFWIAAPGRGEVRTEPLPVPAPGQVLLRALAGAVSRGTESLVFHGRVPPALAAEMRCPFQAGDFPGPVKYGYSLVARVERGPPGLEGRRVFVLHPHQDRAVVPADACRPVPDAVPTDRAVLAANVETALNALWDGAALPGQRITVVGGGVVGCLAAWLAARLPGAEVELVDVEPARASVAARLGVPFREPDGAAGGRDLVLHASGTPEGLATALELAGTEATVVEASWYGDRPVPAPLGAGFHPKRLRLVSSQVGRVAPVQRPRWSPADRLDLALRLLEDPRPDALLDGETGFAELPVAMPRLASGRGLCHLIRYRGQEGTECTA
ncbi:zinc-dependent alcohol dehydrogenase [Rhodospirillum centenum]|uniref:Oxidoreductase, putative n=1 Tax=Rhodospirillum centenum (strain ATCC 51521 / SW) TaxID=414684 RepID=B6IVH5_RHOCS|nr:zinc-binding alcohol dehydrogenase [Rhodospirillum centenum]ACJ00299.1 oxidoreductase, putative [Rhodospirillum centenum SW]